MKDTIVNNQRKKGARLIKLLMILVVTGLGTLGMAAQNSMPAPGSGGNFNPAPIGGGPGNGPGFNGPGPGFGGPGPVGPGWNGGPIMGPAFANQGTVSVMACGFDNMGVFRTIPMTVGYTFSYGQYDVTVISAYNPFTMSWMPGIDMPAYNTSYFLRGQTYDFYAPLSTGTYYFNL